MKQTKHWDMGYSFVENYQWTFNANELSELGLRQAPVITVWSLPLFPSMCGISPLLLSPGLARPEFRVLVEGYLCQITACLLNKYEIWFP